MNPFLKDYLTYTRTQRAGIFTLLLVIVSVQAVYLFVEFPAQKEPDTRERQQWLAMQSVVDSIKVEQRNYRPKIYPFNPNFITDFKGYRLGMSTDEIDRLLAFRKLNKYVNSAVEFQIVTGVSDSLLDQISPYFKFPDWVKNKKSATFQNYKKFEKQNKTIIRKDINFASREDLIKIYGIGPALSERILKQREILGAFVDMSQLSDVWGLSPEVIENLNKYFEVSQSAEIKKIRINDASVKELAAFPYFRYKLAKKIVTYRSMNGEIRNSADLAKINDFPVEKAELIALYLEF